MSVEDTTPDEDGHLVGVHLANVHESLRGICHDLRQPLATVRHLVAAAEADLDSPSALRRWLQLIDAEATYALGVAGSAVVATRPGQEVDLVAVVGEVVQSYRLRGADVRFGRVAPLLVDFDSVGLRRAVQNLLENAVRAAGPAGMVVVRVRRRHRAAEVRVEDSGPGLERGTMPGTGLGLGVVRREIAAVHGRLELGSSPLGGARVRLLLPFGVPLPHQVHREADPGLPQKS